MAEEEAEEARLMAEHDATLGAKRKPLLLHCTTRPSHSRPQRQGPCAATLH